MTLALLAAISLATAGWRADGTATAEVGLPSTWAPTWNTPIDRWGNASPVRLGSSVCITEEPITLACFDAATGALRWRAEHAVVDTLPAAEQAPLLARFAEVPGYEEERSRLLRARSQQLCASRAGDEAARAEVERITARLAVIQAALDEVAWADTRADRDIIGYATPTPVQVGDTLVAQFGNGVVAARDEAGALRWSIWLGPAPRPMRGYDIGTAASPLLVDGTLIVAHDALHGLDPRTGKERWRVEGYRDFGTPAVVQAGRRALLALPDGRLVDARDGTVQAEGLADPWYVGPHAEGDFVVWIGGHAAADNMQVGSVPAVAYRLSESGGGVEPTLAWKTDLPTSDLFYTAPVSRGGKVYSVSRTGEFRVLDQQSGAILHSRDLLKDLGAFVYASPTLVGDRLLLLSERGVLLLLDATAPYDVVARHELGGQHRATPLFTKGGLYLRPLEALVRVGGTP